MHRAATPYFPNLVGLGMAAPTLLHHAREDVKRELLPRLFAADDIWCQGFSEPGAGSDLANQQTFAERRGDHWVINGHKVWTSLAHFADWMILLCRTSREDKYNGLSYFVVPVGRSIGRGVTVRPLIKMTGGTGFNEVLFDDLVVEDRLRLDEVGSGWKVAMTTLVHERGAGALTTPAAGGMVLRAQTGADLASARGLVELARRCWRDGRTAAQDPLIRDEIVRLMIREEGFRQNQRRLGVPALAGNPDRLALQTKLVNSELAQDRAALACEIEGAAGSLYVNEPEAPAGGQWPMAYMNSFGSTIAAGTSEVQRNILGERVLGLPKSR
jgi:alkylation response protein AidB-like acyl-CoA dehydrogenase